MPGQKALLLLEKHGKFAVGSREIEKPGPQELLIKVHATALNPIDWKIQKYGFFYPDDVGLKFYVNIDSS
jgi:NADPH:quinone reductase-like Zn-dependent oxidoreductase